MSLQVFLLPDLGEGLVEAELVTWLVGVGESVHIDQPIAEVETAKSVVEVPSPFEGVVQELHGAEGDTLEVGKPLISVAAADSDGSGNVLIGYGTSAHGGPGRTRPSRLNASPQVSQPPPVGGTAPLVISPLVRKMAHQNGLVLGDIRGSGDGGLILRRDVEAAVSASLTVDSPETLQAPSIPQHGEGASAAVDARTGLPVLARTPLTGVKKAAAAAFTRSRREIPEATVWVDVDATALLDVRAALKSRTGESPSILAFVARFAVAALARFPQLNTQLVSENGVDTQVSFDGINLGFATQTDRGLVVPVVRGAQGRSATELNAAIKELADTVRAGKASPAELSGGTFTLNNYGVFGVDGSAAIINYPEVAMLGIGRIVDKPWVVKGELCVRKMTELTLAFDHRVCDGAVAAGFLRFIADAMEDPAGVLADL
ncbi:dihydrolipoamide acetyltransferase family protein [Arthrobacter sp. GMC3]|uniref:dihydrolipoamide acetyltransferase family protein n=1 Tax=Arthrobacter sp. GMC3 TaxID=2058894 RepID=UPI000CE53292|nr:dihydrolipoamide acetyltransferase family protein [Arthrobacter sp. GMC3]